MDWDIIGRCGGGGGEAWWWEKRNVRRRGVVVPEKEVEGVWKCKGREMRDEVGSEKLKM